jgi:hypothetical protein
VDWFGLLLETFTALWPGEDLAPLPGQITMFPRARHDSDFGSQLVASWAVTALVAADSARVFSGWGGAGVVVDVVGRHVSLECKIDRRSWAVLFVEVVVELKGCLDC